MGEDVESEFEMCRYAIGDYVLYGVSGSCEIVEIGPLSFGGPDKIYYSLKPVYDSRSTIYVPVAKEDEIIRKNISKADADDILKKCKDIKKAKLVINRENCDPVIKSGDNLALAALIKLLRDMRRENRKNHKGLNIQEERILYDAERVFFSEIATAYSLPMDEAVSGYTANLD